jgi:hypothetical protein
MYLIKVAATKDMLRDWLRDPITKIVLEGVKEQMDFQKNRILEGSTLSGDAALRDTAYALGAYKAFNRVLNIEATDDEE